jgi:hypothetical protein
MNKHGGGSQTNLNGLKFEQETSLYDILVSNNFIIKDNYKIFKDGNLIGYYVPKHELYKYFLKIHNIVWQNFISKKMLPDEAIFIISKNTMFILEKKFQSTSGSVDEKLQTCDFKLKQYKKLFSSISINTNYTYILNDWFKQDGYKDMLNYIIESGCSYFYNEIPYDFLF